MINSITSALSNPTFANVTQNIALSVSVETGLKSLGRPGFILIDNNIDEKTKAYAATKEFLYQAICLGVYLLVIPPIFKIGTFKLAKKVFGKKYPEFNKFINLSEYEEYHRFTMKSFENRKASLKKLRHSNKFQHDGLVDDLKNLEKPNPYPLIKGTIEASTFVGTVLGLAILAPQISHFTIHPIMRLLGFEKYKK